MIVSPQPSCHNRPKSLNSFSVSLLGRLYLEAKSRPLFVVSEILTATEVEARKQVCRHASNPAENLSERVDESRGV
jgi:hypothetical protein